MIRAQLDGMDLIVPRQFRFLIVIAAVVALFSQPDTADAHPHAWVDLRTTLVMDDSHRVVAIEQDWLFGDFYSGYVLADIQSSGDDMVDALRETARQNLVNLREYDYFTRVLADGETQVLKDVKTFETGVLSGRIYMRFTVELAEPVDPRAHAVRYSVYDPTYYIEILYAEGAKPEIGGVLEEGCRTSVETPDPSFEDFAYASSLDQSQQAADGLGAVFAEWVDLACD